MISLSEVPILTYDPESAKKNCHVNAEKMYRIEEVSKELGPTVKDKVRDKMNFTRYNPLITKIFFPYVPKHAIFSSKPHLAETLKMSKDRSGHDTGLREYTQNAGDSISSLQFSECIQMFREFNIFRALALAAASGRRGSAFWRTKGCGTSCENTASCVTEKAATRMKFDAVSSKAVGTISDYQQPRQNRVFGKSSFDTQILAKRRKLVIDTQIEPGNDPSNVHSFPLPPLSAMDAVPTTTKTLKESGILVGTTSKSNLVVDIEPKRPTAVRLGESLQILCRVGRPLRVCRVEIPGEEGGIVLSKGQPPEDGIEYYGEGTEAGQCGVRIAKIKESHDGIFKCTLTTTDSRSEEQASMRIIVAKPPNNPELHTSQGSDGRNIYRKGEKLEVSCSAPGGRPAANVSLFLDPPQPQPTIERFGYVIGRQGIVNVTVYANPRPRFLWRVNNEIINEGRPDESNRLETSTAVDLGRGAWSVILTIDSVQKSDTEKEYILEARNGEGAYEYRIILSTATEPAEKKEKKKRQCGFLRNFRRRFRCWFYHRNRGRCPGATSHRFHTNFCPCDRTLVLRRIFTTDTFVVKKKRYP
ncbi:Fasciclin-3 [Apis cerana cerana]|uniref:Fasciclin-3 n=1 Tax=Apis cerana cerana TaxID=94128 RepID=A0A2A3EI57_APICC|nr:Fasciclin-3 [Apis cerana cerana]